MNRPEAADPTALLRMKRLLVSPHRRFGEAPTDAEAHAVLVVAIIEAVGATTPWLAEVIDRLGIAIWLDDTGFVALALPGREELLALDTISAAFAERLLIAGALATPAPEVLLLPAAGGIH